MLTRGIAANVKPFYYRILSKFPSNFSLCFAYGSGVKKQLGYEGVAAEEVFQKPKAPPKKPIMIDLLFTVENPYQWHSQNLLANPSHYSSMRHLGSNFIASYQESYGAKVYFNTLVPVDDSPGIMIKYGVISTRDLSLIHI